MAWAMRLSRVSGRLASAIHSMYSRLQLGLKAAKTLEAALLDLRAEASSGGVSSAGLAARAMVCFLSLRAAMGLVYSPLSMKAAACLKRARSCLLEGRSLGLVMRPTEPMGPSWRIPA